MTKNIKTLLSGLTCFTAFMVFAPTLAHATLTVTIGEGSFVTDDVTKFTFAPNTAVVSGGSGSYTFIWSRTVDLGNWSGGAGQTFSPSVEFGGDCDTAEAIYTVTVTDSVTGAMAVSNSATYDYHFFRSGSICP
jgi:hypothetical protein